MKRLKIRGGLYQVIDTDANKKLNFGSLEEAEAYMAKGSEEVVVKKEAEIPQQEEEEFEATFDFTHDDDLNL
jgi:hypothetical protein